MREVALLEKHQVTALTWNDERYPARLKEIFELPPVLYVKGDWRTDDWGVVGARQVGS